MWRTSQAAAGLRRLVLTPRSLSLSSLPSRQSPRSPPAIANLVKPPLTSFAACLPGLEPMLSSEIKRLGGSKMRPVRGGCHVCIASIEDLYRLHLHVGTASHIYLRY